MNHFADIGKNMIIADKYFKLYLKNALEPYNINAAEGMVLLMMYKMNGVDADPGKHVTNHKSHGNTQDELIKEIHYDKGVMTRTMKSLEEKGFVERMQNPADSRSFVFSLTERAISFKQTLIDILKRWEDKLLEGIDEKVLIIVNEALMTMAQNSISCFNKKSTADHLNIKPKNARKE